MTMVTFKNFPNMKAQTPTNNTRLLIDHLQKRFPGKEITVGQVVSDPMTFTPRINVRIGTDRYFTMNIENTRDRKLAGFTDDEIINDLVKELKTLDPNDTNIIGYFETQK